jgi:hypothetical protein
MATMLEEYASGQQRSVAPFFLWEKGLNAKIVTNKCVLFTVGYVCRLKRFHIGGKRFAVDEEVETVVQEWLRRQRKYFYAAGFDALVKRWDKRLSVGGGYL